MRREYQRMVCGVLAAIVSLTCLTGLCAAAGSGDPYEDLKDILAQGDKDKLEEYLEGMEPYQPVITEEEISAIVARFEDVEEDDWFAEYVAPMVRDGLFEGLSATEFAPDYTMRESQFLTVVLRKAWPQELEQYNAANPGNWYTGACKLAMDKGLISAAIYGTDYAAINRRLITRERMTDIVIRAMEALGEDTTVDTQAVKNNVFDLYQCKPEFQDSMVKAYGLGIITGTDTDSAGRARLRPTGEASRAQAATILYRFAYPQERVQPTLKDLEAPEADLSQPITIYEGQPRFDGQSRIAREGDTFVKKDGTKVVLKKGPTGIVGEGQGVAPDLLFCEDPEDWDAYVREGDTYGVVLNQIRFEGYAVYQVNSLGDMVLRDTYQVDPWSGEGHWSLEWSAIGKAKPFPSYEGTYDGQLSENGVWVWDSTIRHWIMRCNCKEVF